MAPLQSSKTCMGTYGISFNLLVPNKRVQSDATTVAGIGAKIGYVTYFVLRHSSGKSRRG